MEFIEKVLLLGDPGSLGYTGMFEWMIQFHISFGLISLITGTVILMFAKGNELHRKVGRYFVIAMMGNFLLGVPLGSLGQLVVGEPANIMTVLGALFVGTVTFSGYRLAKAGASANAWYDKGMLGLQVVTAGLYVYIAALMTIGTSLFGLTALTRTSAEQFVFADNMYPIFSLDVALVSTVGGKIFAIIASENFITPVFFALLLVWFSMQDWRRIRGNDVLPRAAVIEQHLTRLTIIYAAAITAVLLNTSWLSFGVCWSLPPALALIGVSYYKRAGRNRRSALQTQASPT